MNKCCQIPANWVSTGSHVKKTNSTEEQVTIKRQHYHKCNVCGTSLSGESIKKIRESINVESSGN